MQKNVRQTNQRRKATQQFKIYMPIAGSLLQAVRCLFIFCHLESLWRDVLFRQKYWLENQKNTQPHTQERRRR